MTEPQAYTTAIIAAVPAQDDAVHEVVAEDAHVTLQFLGEADNLTEEQIGEIEQALEMLASVVYPFEADISGTAELGSDKAQVLIVQSALLTKIRETLGASEAVSTAVAAADQFPNWIPHLTLAYEGEMPDVSAFESVTIGSLELWLADEHRVFPLLQPKQAVTAAGIKEFEEGLHPRGADGRFIEKFGVIKFLTGMGWQYGKVEGIYQDKHSGAIKLTITPSDLAGKTHGDSVVLSPKQVYRAPQPKAHLLVNAVGVQKTGGQGGSNPGGLYSIPSIKPVPLGDTAAPAVDQFYVKTPKTKSHGNNEALANLLYEEAGVPVPEVDLAADGKLYSKIIKGKQDMSSQLDNPEWTDQVRRNFAVDAWLGNRDVFGMTYDNVLTDDQGVPWRIDNGGALLYRAMGEKKTDFGSAVTELDAFRTGKKAKIYGSGMSKTQELDGAERVLAISPGQIDDLVKAHNMPQSLADTLKARRLYIADYYGLALPESKTPPDAEGPTSAPLVDAVDIAESGGKNRNWFKTALTHLGMLGQAGDVVEFSDGNTQLLGVDDNQQALSIVGEQAQHLKWLQKYGPDAQVYLKKQIDPNLPRPEHGQMLAGSDLTAQRWKRGDKIVDSEGVPWDVLAWNDDTGAMLVQFHTTQGPTLLDTKGKDGGGVWKVERWDPPVVDTAEPVQTEQQATSMVEDLLAKHAAEPPTIQTLSDPGTGTQTPDYTSPLVTDLIDQDVTGEYSVAPAPGKTGQAAVAETQIKADLNQPLPNGSGAPAPAKTTGIPGAKSMVIGDGTEAATGAAVTSKKDGKTYTFVKPKGQYAVVTDPNSDTPDKQLLKLASTMTQPDKAPSADAPAIEAPKTATGEVPALGMMAVSKDGHAGKITLISPDGKFVFITDATGTRKRKSTGTVTITAGAEGVVEAPKTSPGPIKDYGSSTNLSWTGEDNKSGYFPPEQLMALNMVHVVYTDGTDSLEPYSGQPIDSLETNAQGQVATYGEISDWLGPVSASQLIAASDENNNSFTQQYFVVWDGNVFLTNGKAGPGGGLVLHDAQDPASYAFELPSTPQTLTIVDSLKAEDSGITIPDFDTVPGAQAAGDMTYSAPPLLYGDEAKTLADWKDQTQVGSQISLDGKNWLEVTHANSSGSVTVKDSNGAQTFLNAYASSKYALKAPDLKDGNAPDPAMQPTPDIPGTEALPVDTGKKKIGDLVKNDVVIDGNGETSIIDSVDDYHGVPDEVMVKALGEDFGSPANPNFEFTHLGNIAEAPVTVPAGLVAPHLYPGAQVELGPGHKVQLVSFPEQLDNGNYRFAAIPLDDPEGPMLVTIGDGPGADIAASVPVSAQLGAFTTYQDAGADINKINALFDTAKVQDPSSLDHNAQMTDQGIPFGSAQYPIYYNDPSGTYFRAAHHGLEEWDSENGQWNAVFGTVEGKTKVWEGVPFTGKLELPADYPTEILGNSSGKILDYQPKPGETVELVKANFPSGQESLLVSYPFGTDGPAHAIIASVGTEGGAPHASTSEFQPGWKTEGTFTDPVMLHDPFAAPVDTSGAALTHHEGPQPPAELGANLQAKGYTPNPGETILVVKPGVDSPVAGHLAALVKQDDGNYKAIQFDGALGNKVWTAEEIKAKYPGSTTYSWTYLPAGTEAPAAVQGLPENYAPLVPNDGVSVLKVTLPNNKTNVYLQKQPGAGWYELSPDGTVNESSGAVKSDHVVQMKLAGKGAQAAKYELLHPQPEGQKSGGAEVPTLSNAMGGWTPDPHQKVIALTSHAGDTDPWYFVQDEPGGVWVPSPNSTQTGIVSVPDVDMQAKVKLHPTTSDTGYTTGYKLIYDGNGHSAVDTPDKQLPTFSGYTPKDGDAVFEEANNSHWVLTADDGKYHAVNDDGTLAQSFTMTQTEWDLAAKSSPSTQVWPAAAAAPAAPEAPPTFNGLTPSAGQKVVQVGADDSPNKHFYVQTAAGGQWQLVGNDGQPSLSSPLTEADMQQALGSGNVNQVWPIEAKGGTFAGYQTQAGDSAILMGYPGGENKTLVKKDGESVWHVVMPDGSLGNPDDGDAYSQDTIEWAATANAYTLDELQGTWKPSPTSPAEPLPTSNETYAGVGSATPLSKGHYHFGTYQPSQDQQIKLDGMATLQPGQSVYLTQPGEGAQFGGAVMTRQSDGSWHAVGYDGFTALSFGDDEDAENWFQSNNVILHKLQFGAPTAAPAPAANTYTGPPITGWADSGVPNPASFGFIGTPDAAAGMKAGTWLYTQSAAQKAAGDSGGATGLFVQLAEDVPAGGDSVKVSGYAAVVSGQVQELKHPSTGKPINFNLGGTVNVYGQNVTGTQAAPGAQVPTNAPSAPTPAAPSAPAVPAYPGALKPSQEDINAWGGDLTKDGHIPSAGMYVTGKGPMSGKVVSVSKDKTKATVLTSDGKKTTRLIVALKTDPSANYSAYAAPVTLKDIPAGMPLAVDTVADALQKTAADGKFRAILNGHPGVSHGQMVVTKATAPSGKVYNRVHLTLTPAQRDQLTAMLAGTGEKGDWVKSSKSSEAVAIGDQLPMRKSSTDNPDGTPRWKVDPDTKPPTHKVTKVEDDPAGGGIKIVTMENTATGETIISRFHSGKTLTIYNWDANKPKAVTPGAFSVSQQGKAQGWSFVTDGGISAAKGGADNAVLYNEPGLAVTKGALQHAQPSSGWKTLRNVSADGTVIEIIEPKGADKSSNTGVTVISLPQGTDEKALGAALAKMGIDYRPMNQDDAKESARGLLRTLLSFDPGDVDTSKGWSDEKLFTEAGKTMGISDLGWQDVLVGVDDSTGKTSFFWSDRARNALAAKSSYNLVYRAATNGSADQIVSTVKYGSANSVLKRTAGMLDGSSGVGGGASWSSDSANHAGYGSYASASTVNKLPSSNPFASYKSAGMMIYHRPEAVLGRIMDYRLASNDAFGMGQGHGANHLKAATSMGSVRDYFLGEGLPTEAVGFIAVDSATARDTAIAKLKADGYATINGRPIEDIVITKQKAATMKPSDLPPVTIPANARPILSLPLSYDAAPAAAEGPTAGEAAA